MCIIFFLVLLVPVPGWSQNYPHLDKHRLHNPLTRDVRLFYTTGEGGGDVDFGLIGSGEMKPLDLPQGHTFFAVDTLTGKRLNNVTLGYYHGDYYFTTGSEDDDIEPFQERISKWMTDYKTRTGRDWLSKWPREPIIHKMWDPVEIGYKRSVKSKLLHWHEGESVEAFVAEEPELEMEIVTFSTEPKAFTVKNFLSDEECEFIMKSASGKLIRSVVGTKGVESQGRTSASVWLPFNAVISHIFKRLGDVLQIDHFHMLNKQAAEDLMVVYYDTLHRYNDHVDWFDYNDSTPEKQYIARGNNRYISAVIYLNDVEEGGHTAFPLSELGPDTKVAPEKGSMVFFYDLLEDGNCDPKSKHAGRPPTKGEKYVGVTWIWDPYWR